MLLLIRTGCVVATVLNGFLFVRRAGGLPGGYDNGTLQRLAMIAQEESVNHIIIETNSFTPRSGAGCRH